MSDLPIFSIKYSDQDVCDRLVQLSQKIGDMTPAMQEIGEYCLTSVDARFQSETDIQGKPWQKLSPFTVNRKRAEGKIAKILQSTGLMRSRTAYTATSDRCIVHNNDVKAKKHHFGIGVPQRQFLGVSPEDKVEIVAILDDYLKD